MIARIAVVGIGLLMAGFVLAGAGPDAVHGSRSVGDASAPNRTWPCPPDALFAQPAEGCDEPSWSAYASAVGLDFTYLCQENFDDYGELCGLHWWGLALRWNSGWTAGDPAALVFDIVFYADAGGAPGAAVCSYFGVTPTFSYRETCFDEYDVYYFEAPVLNPCCVGNGPGWVSVQSRQAPPNYDLFLWVTSEFGDSYALQNGGNLGTDLGFCLTGLYIPAWGACGADATSACAESVERLDCRASGGRFAADTLCADLQPPCGQFPGACCYDNAVCTLVTAALCGVLLGDADCDGDVDFADIDPFVAALSGGDPCNAGACDCDQDGDVDFDDVDLFVCFIQQQCPPINGHWLGGGSLCAECPCIVPCPPGSTLENEPCYTNANGGCGSSPYLWGWINCGETICGTSFLDGADRDTDWFRIDTGATYVFTLTAAAEFDLQLLFLRDDGADCENYQYWYVWVAQCDLATLSTDCFPPSSFYVWVGPQFTGAFPCADGDLQYWVHLDCLWCFLPLGACCKGGLCYSDYCESDCLAINGTWLGDGTDCDSNPCPPGLPGERCETAIVIAATLPFDADGDTCPFMDEYDEVCPYSGSTAPEVVYKFTPVEDVFVQITLEYDNTCYDTKLYVYAGTCTGDPLACNDDCGSTACLPWPYVSHIPEVFLPGGVDYFIVVDGYADECGTYHIGMWEVFPCTLDCTPGAVPEQEPCGSDTNNGCSLGNPTFEPLDCGTTVCGTAWFDGNARDTDWYELVLTEPATVTVTGVAEFRAIFGWLEQIIPGVPGCENVTGYFIQYVQVDPCVEGVFTTECRAPGTYYIWIGPQWWDPIGCGVLHEYVLTITCAPCAAPPGPDRVTTAWDHAPRTIISGGSAR